MPTGGCSSFGFCCKNQYKIYIENLETIQLKAVKAGKAF